MRPNSHLKFAAALRVTFYCSMISLDLQQQTPPPFYGFAPHTSESDHRCEEDGPERNRIDAGGAVVVSQRTLGVSAPLPPPLGPIYVYQQHLQPGISLLVGNHVCCLGLL